MRWLQVLPWLAGVFASTACGGGEQAAAPHSEGGVDPSFREIRCRGLELESMRGQPLDEIAIGELPSAFESTAAVSVSVGDAGHLSFAYLLDTDADEASGGPRLLVPLHPLTPFEGGDVTLTVSDGTRACPPVDFEIGPLPRGRGKLAALVKLLQEVLEAQVATLESTPSELRKKPIDRLPAGLVPLAMAQAVLDHPDNSSSLEALANGGLSKDDLRVVDGVLAKVAKMAATSSGKQNPPQVDPYLSAFDCLPEAIPTTPPDVLHNCMEAGVAAIAAATGPIARKVSEDIKKAFTTVAAHPAFAAPGSAASTALGALFWVVYTERERAAALLPSRFESFQVKVDKPRFLEDEEGSGKIESARVVAQNLGYNLQAEIEGAVEQAVSVSKASGSFDFSTGTPADKVTDNLKKQVDQRLKKDGNQGPKLEEFQIPVESFGPVDVDDPDWIEVRVAAGTAVAVPEGTLDYEPRSRGMSSLAVQTNGERFGGQQVFATAEVEVAPIRIVITPMETYVAPTDPDDIQFVEFEVEVIDSKHPEMIELEDPHPKQGSASLNTAPGGSTIAYLAPDAPDYSKVDYLVVRHIAETGARAFSDEEVRQTATIRFGAVEIASPPACLSLGGEETFMAAVKGPEDERVTWSADHGEVDEESGRYIAPEVAPPGGRATIRAVSVANPDLEDEVVVALGCTCQASLTVGGQTIEAAAGDVLYFTDWNDPMYEAEDEFFAIVWRTASGDETVAFPLDDDPATWPTVGGTHPVRAQGDIGLEGSEIIYSSDDEFPALIALEQYVPEKKAVGSVTADVTITSTADPFSTPTTLTWSFAVTVPAGSTRGSIRAPYGARFSCTVGGAE